MVHGAVHYFLRGLMGIALIFLLIIIAMGVRLSQGPLSIDFANKTIEEMLSYPAKGITVKLDHTTLAFSSEGKLIDIRLDGLTLYGGGDIPLAVIPESSVSLSLQGLLKGKLIPDSVVFYRPKMYLVRDERGYFQWNLRKSEETPSSPTLDDPQNPNFLHFIIRFIVGEQDDSLSAVGGLTRFEIVDATLEMEDLQSHFMIIARDMSLAIERYEEGALIEHNFSLEIMEEKSQLESSFTWIRSDGSLSGLVKLHNFRPSHFSGFEPNLTMANFPLSGEITLRGKLAIDEASIAESPDLIPFLPSLNQVNIDLKSGAGYLHIPSLNWQYAVKEIILQAELQKDGQRVSLDKLDVTFGNDERLILDAHLEDVEILTGRLNGVVELNASLSNVAFDSLPALWPLEIVRDVRVWITQNISAGVVEKATLKAIARSSDGSLANLKFDSISGTLKGSGVTVDYLSPLPKVEHGSGTGVFDHKNLDLTITGGNILGLKAMEGNIRFSGLDQKDQFMEITVDAEGPVSDALTLIDHKPLGYAREFGIYPKTVSGHSYTTLNLSLPLLHELLLEDVKIKATSRVTDLFIPKFIKGKDISNGNITLVIDGKGMDIEGGAALAGVPGQVILRENFTPEKGEFISRYEVLASSIDNKQRESLGLSVAPFVPPWIDGSVDGKVIATNYANGVTKIEADLDMTQSRMNIVKFGWSKDVGQAAKTKVRLDLKEELPSDLPYFQVTAPDLDIMGSGGFNVTGGLEWINLKSVAYGSPDGRHSEGSGRMVFSGDDHINIMIRARHLDGKAILGRDKSGSKDKSAPEAKTSKDQVESSFDLTLDVEKLWLSDDGYFQDVKGNINLVNGNVSTARIDGISGENGRVQLDIRPEGQDKSKLTIVSDDAGGIFHALGVGDSIHGGILDLYGYYDNTKPHRPLSGEMRVREFHVVGAPLLARVLTVAALTGIGDVLAGEGMYFKEMSTNYILSDEILKFPDFRAHGNSIGLTSQGAIDIGNDTIDLKGVVIPAYSINSVLGEIPIIGWMLTAGESGGGILAMNYSLKGSMDDPQVTVNPLSVLTPGFLRHVFSIFDEKPPASTTPKSESSPQSSVELPSP